ncbi:MAG: hypothetical protein GY679_02390 [Mycoplasma sp.]|nr:hypothetical protein [Mycoplasma sp.]
MKNKNKSVSVSTIWKWVITVAWALTFIFLFVFIGIVAGFTKTAKKTTQGHWMFRSTFKVANNGKDVKLPSIKTIDFTGIANDAKTAMDNKVDLTVDISKLKGTQLKNRQEYDSALTDFNKSVDKANKAFTTDEKAAISAHDAAVTKVKAAYDKAAKAAKKINVKVKAVDTKAYFDGMEKADKDLDKAIQTAKDKRQTAVKAAQKVYRPKFLKAFSWKNKEQEKDTWVKPDFAHVYDRGIAEALAWDSQANPTSYWAVDKYAAGEATPEAKKASNYIAGFALGFVSILTTSIFSTAIIKYYLKGGNK